MEFFRQFSAQQYAGALESWGFVDLRGKTPVFTSPFGDIFFSSDDGYWWLDTLEGRLLNPWADKINMEQALNTDAGQDHYLSGVFAQAANRLGLVPAESQVYGFKIAPVLGGAIEVENIEVVDFVVSLNILGQIHSQFRSLAPGTKISGFTMDGKPPR
jgi:hypothetical protein